MTRLSIVTGSASGIGRATKELLESRGERVIGVDIRDADIRVDLATAAGRAAMIEGVQRIAGAGIDAVYAVAGLSQPTEETVAVNYFGAIATVEGLRPLLLTSPTPRAIVVSSMAALMPVDTELMAALTAGDEIAAVSRAAVMAKDPELAPRIYCSSKKALSQWVRCQAAGLEWAGAGIPLNAVAPGIIATPMTAELTSTPEKTAALLQLVPMPLNGIAEAVVVARLLAWLGGAENTHLCGQVVYVDGGSDAVMRGDSVW